MSTPISGDRSFHLIEAVADRIEGAPVGRRRRWSEAFKAEMAARSCEAGANVSALAREIGISPSQLFSWRSVSVRKGAIERRDAAGCGVGSESGTAPSPGIEIDVNGMKVRAGADVDEAICGVFCARCVRHDPAGVKVYLASHPVDFRKGIDGLLALVRGAGSVRSMVHCTCSGRNGPDRIKIVWWDGSGAFLYLKRLEKVRFVWPPIGHHRVQLHHAQLLALVDGMDWKRVQVAAIMRPKSVG